MRVRDRSAAVGDMREASGSVRRAINELTRVRDVVDDDDLVVEEAREQLLAALHLIDGAGVALRRNGL